MSDGDELDRTRRAIAGDRAALETLWRAHRRWLSAVLLVHKPAGAELEDLLQDTAVHVCRKIGDLREPERLRPWLRAVAVHAAISAGRAATVRRHLRPVPIANPQDEPADPAPERKASRDASAEALDRALAAANRLPPDYREALLLKAVRGLSQREIAETLELPETTVETRLARARRMLRAQLEAGSPTERPALTAWNRTP